MQNKEKCLHATPLSETALIPTIQDKEGNGNWKGGREGGKREGREEAEVMGVILGRGNNMDKGQGKRQHGSSRSLLWEHRIFLGRVERN